MEKNAEQEKKVKEKIAENNVRAAQSGEVLLSKDEAAEYRNYKRQKYVSSVGDAVGKTALDARGKGSTEELTEFCRLALRYGVAAVKTTGGRLQTLRSCLGNGKTLIDCAVGGDGSVCFRTKRYEGKIAVRYGARELTYAPDLFMIKNGRYAELKKELRAFKRAFKKTLVKLSLEAVLDETEIYRLAKIASECGVGVSARYFVGAERLKAEMPNAFVEVLGVQDAAAFRRLYESGVDRLGTDSLTEIYTRLMQEAENCTVGVSVVCERSDGKTDGSVYRALVE